jgi:hypothetical protein
MNKFLELADYIEQNPEEFDMWEWDNCIIGLGCRINGFYPKEIWQLKTVFRQIFNTPLNIVNALAYGSFTSISSELESSGNVPEESPVVLLERAVKALRYLGNE